MQDHTKALNTLMSKTAPLIKKRQIMRLSFGDYRNKMAKEEKKIQSFSVKFTQPKPSEKSTFIRKALRTGSDFKFNFSNPSESTTEIQDNGTHNDVTNENKMYAKTSVFISDNSFRFSFNTEEPPKDSL